MASASRRPRVGLMKQCADVLSSLREGKKMKPPAKDVRKALRMYSQCGKGDIVQEIIDNTQTGYKKTITPYQKYEYLLTARLKARDFTGIFRDFERYVGFGRMPTRAMCHNVITAAGLVGRGHQARSFVDKMQHSYLLEIDGATVQVLMHALLESGDEVGVIDVGMNWWGIENLPQVGPVYVDLIRAHGMAFGAKEAMELGLIMPQYGFEMDLACAEEMLRVCAAEGDVEGARGVWKGMEATKIHPTELAAERFSECLALNGAPVARIAEEVLGRAVEKQGENGEVMLVGDVVAGVARAKVAIGDSEEAVVILTDALANNPSPAVIEAAIQAYAAQGNFEAAEKAFAYHPSARSRQTLIAAYGQNDRAEQAVEVASSASSMQMKTVGTLMQAVGGRGDALEELAWRACPSPIVRSCGMGLRGLFLGRAQRGDPIAAATAAQEMVVSNGFTPSERLITAAVSKSKRPLQLIDALIERGIAVSARPFNTLMSFATDPRDVEKTVAELDSREIYRDSGTYRELIDAHLREGDIDRVFKVIDEMETVEGDYIEAEPYLSVMEHYAAEGDIEACWGIFVRMSKQGIEGNPSIYRALARSVIVDGAFDLEYAHQLFITSSQKEDVSLDADMLVAEMKAVDADFEGGQGERTEVEDGEIQGEDDDLLDEREFAAEAVMDEDRHPHDLSVAERHYRLREISPKTPMSKLKAHYSNPRLVILDRLRMMGTRPEKINYDFNDAENTKVKRKTRT